MEYTKTRTVKENPFYADILAKGYAIIITTLSSGNAYVYLLDDEYRRIARYKTMSNNKTAWAMMKNMHKCRKNSHLSNTLELISWDLYGGDIDNLYHEFEYGEDLRQPKKPVTKFEAQKQKDKDWFNLMLLQDEVGYPIVTRHR